jgi:hypothetical protein
MPLRGFINDSRGIGTLRWLRKPIKVIEEIKPFPSYITGREAYRFPKLFLYHQIFSYSQKNNPNQP